MSYKAINCNINVDGFLIKAKKLVPIKEQKNEYITHKNNVVKLSERTPPFSNNSIMLKL